MDGNIRKQIYGKGIEEINTNELQKGFYLMKISTPQVTITKTFIKQ
jgi:hypothetical protein